MRYLYISLVGTSILRNVCQRVKDKWIEKHRDIETWYNMGLDDPRNIYPDGMLCKLKVYEHDLYEDLVDVAISLAEKASAEISGFTGLTSICNHSRSAVNIVLYPTASCTSILSAELNRIVLLKLGFKSIEIEILEKLGRSESFEEGLIELLDKVITRIEEARSRGIRVFVNATPGFKAESSFLVLASLLAGASGVIYIHETFREPIFMPAIPIGIDREFAEIVENIGDRIPLEAWSSIEFEKRLELRERGIVRCVEDYCEIRPWISALVKRLRQIPRTNPKEPANH